MSAWLEREADADVLAELIRSGHPPIFARLLAARGIDSSHVSGYLSPDWRDLAQPQELPGIDHAASLILDEAKTPDKIAVFGDYDCDGVCATAILTLALRKVREAVHGDKLGKYAKVVPFLPERLNEGYGLSTESINRLIENHPDVRMVVTVDNGVNAVEQIDSLKSRGISVVVTDHHLRGETLPRADALIDPKVSAPSHLSDLCGAAVAYFLARAIVDKARASLANENVARGLGGCLFTLAGLATITDIMPLSGQNRILVAESLKHFPRWAPVGLRELHSRAARTGVEGLTAKDFAFMLGPRINAVGRLGSSLSALRLVMCPEQERETARALAMDIDLANSRRRQIEQRMTDAALAQIRPGAAAQVIAFSSSNPDVHPGVAGIVASRVVEKLLPQVPVCVLVDGKGSSRAPACYNVRDALAHAADTLNQFGGHAAAAGLAVKPGMLDDFRAKFAAACAIQAESIPPQELGARFYDLALESKDITLDLADAIERMEPFGEANPEPVFALKRVKFSPNGVRQFGATGAHLTLSFSDSNIPKAVWWGKGDMVDELRSTINWYYDMYFTLAISSYGGRHVEICITDLVPCLDGYPP